MVVTPSDNRYILRKIPPPHTHTHTIATTTRKYIYITAYDYIHVWCCGHHSLIDIDVNDETALQMMGLLNESEETSCDGVPLEDKGCNEEVEAYAAKSIALQERHQKTETDENHDMDILEHCRKKKKGGGAEERNKGHATTLFLLNRKRRFWRYNTASPPTLPYTPPTLPCSRSHSTLYTRSAPGPMSLPKRVYISNSSTHPTPDIVS